MDVLRQWLCRAAVHLPQRIVGTLAEGIACRLGLGLYTVESRKRTGPRIDEYGGQAAPQSLGEGIPGTSPVGEGGTRAVAGQIAHICLGVSQSSSHG